MAVPEEPMAVQEESPSPMIPIIVLLILGVMMIIPSMFMTYDPKVYWTAKMAEVQTHFVLGAFLIPICLLLAVQAFGIPHVNPTDAPQSPSPPTVVESISHNLTTSVILVVIIIVLLMFIPLRNVLQGPWQPPPSSYGRNQPLFGRRR
ncbi:unnamed protein product [Calypogeia fissa]